MARILSSSVVAPSTSDRAFAVMASLGSNWPSFNSTRSFATAGHDKPARLLAPKSRFTPTQGTMERNVGEAGSRSMAGRFSICQVNVLCEDEASLGAPLKDVDLISQPDGSVTVNRASSTGELSWK